MFCRYGGVGHGEVRRIIINHMVWEHLYKAMEVMVLNVTISQPLASPKQVSDVPNIGAELNIG